jgi:hypothetical protein
MQEKNSLAFDYKPRLRNMLVEDYGESQHGKTSVSQN